MFECPNGSFVGRDACNDCEFSPCKIEDKNLTSSGTACNQVCAEDLFNCPNGSYVERDPCDYCNFQPCVKNANITIASDGKEDKYITLRAKMGLYPNSTFGDNPEGDISMTFLDSGDIFIALHVNGISKDCSINATEVEAGCTIQIFRGITCQNANLIGTPWWNDEVFDFNPWLDVTYSSTTSEIIMTAGHGYDAKTSVGHAVGIHAADGNRIACGILEEETASSDGIAV